ncbi:MAG: type II TA system antitoxin MqsA family protein [Petrimonas sp.]|jgi:putative zinc finger/helix-turn-helix YgiT family protein
MKSPFTNKEMIVRKERRTMSFRKEEFNILFHSYQCSDTGEQFEDEAFAQLNYNQVVNQYREKYNIPFPEQIISIRQKYNVSAAKMSEILGFGINGYRQYEAGEIPSQANAKLIRLADDPHEFKKLADYCSTLSTKLVDKIHRTVENLIEEQKKNKLEKQLENYFFGSYFPNSLTGFKVPDLSKFTEMVVFFTEELQPWKTKLNKLLFYADFTMYQQRGFSISGVQYRAIPMGPVPNNFNSIFEYLVNKKDIDIYYTTFPDGGVGEQFKPNLSKSFNKELFTDSELQILHSVIERFKDTSTNEIIDISHKEKAWIENSADKKLIDYKYGFELN